MSKTFITLTTDCGTKDYYLALIKTKLLLLCKKEIEIIDISHNITPHDITEAAYILKNVIHIFPEGTIHIVDICSEATETTPHICIKRNNSYFIGTDNGLFSLVFPDFEELYEINLPRDSNFLTFSAGEIFVKVASMLVNGIELKAIGQKKQTLINILKPLQPQIFDNLLIGYIEYIDHYGNLISNIHIDLFKKFVEGTQSYTIYISKEDIDKISESYSDAEPGALVACFNSSGYLEIAMNKGNAAKILGVRKADPVRIIKS